MAGLFHVATLAAAAAASAQPSQPAPLQLKVDQEGAMTIVRVVGLANVPWSGRYVLEVTDKAGGNRSVQRGSVRLQSGLATTEATVRTSSANVIAKLIVTPNESPEYEQTVEP